MKENLLKAAVLIDLPRSRLSGGHIKGWERIAKAAAQSNLPLDLTLFCSGASLTEELSSRVRIVQVPPVFSTAKLKFLPYIPDNTDLARFHKDLAYRLQKVDVMHTTDGFFCMAQTAEAVHQKKGIPITTSFHTDTPAYAEIFTQNAIENLVGQGALSRLLIEKLKLPYKQKVSKLARLRKHLSFCSTAFCTRQQDRDIAESVLDSAAVVPLRLGVDRKMMGPHRADRIGIENDYNIPQGRMIFLFVGRLDVGKNIYTLIEAMENLISIGEPVHLITAGLGPAEDDLKARLGNHVSVAGFVDPEELARLYASVDALAACSEVEIRSMAAVEAITSGLPVLISEKCGIAALFDNTPAMLVVKGGPNEWTLAMRDFLGSINKRTHMRKVALAYADTHIANWSDVLTNDLYPQWYKAATGKAP